jgi:hypothetical protein
LQVQILLGKPTVDVFIGALFQNNTKWARPNNVYLCPDITDPENTLTVWVQNTAYWGKPMITVDTNGTWYAQPAMSATLPNTGWVVLPFNTVSTV